MRLTGKQQALEAQAAREKSDELAELTKMVARGHVVGDGPYGSPGDDSADLAGFYAYMKSGDTSGIRNTALSTTDANGGYVIPEPEHAALVELVHSVDPILSRCAKVSIAGANPDIVLPYKSGHGVATTAAETAARAEQVEPVFTSRTITASDYFTNQYVSQTWLDSWPAAEATMVRWLYEDIAEKMAVDAAVGNGSTCFKGLFAETSFFGTEYSGSATTLLNSSPIKLFMAMHEKFLANAVWLCNSTTLGVLAGFADPANADAPLVNKDQWPWRMYGKDVLVTSNAPSPVAGAYVLAFADLSACYVVATSRQTTILRDPFTQTPLVRYYALARAGGAGFDPAACHLLRCATA